MKKTFVFTLAMVVVLGITGAALAAANPFVDVPANHWSYDAVSTLAKAGIIDGYSDGTFRGDRTITRYEMAQVVAKALAGENKADAQQKAVIDKLAVEFAGELNNLGVRVTKLEKNRNPLNFSGEVYVRYQSQDLNDPANSNPTGAQTAKGQWRLRLNANANIDDQTTATLRFTTQPGKAGTRYTYNSTTLNTFGGSEGLDSNKNSFRLDRAYLTRNVGAVKVIAGAQPLAFGANNFAIDSGQYSFDGLSILGKSGVVNTRFVWGRFQLGTGIGGSTWNSTNGARVDVAGLVANSQWGKLTYEAGYLTLKDNSTGASKNINGTNVAFSDKYLAKYLDFNASYLFDKRISLSVEYLNNRSDDFDEVLGDNKNSWLLKAVYGDQTLKKAGDRNLTATYVKIGRNGFTRWTNGDYSVKSNPADTDALTDMHNNKAWSIAYNYAISPNLSSTLLYEKITDDDANSAGDFGYQTWRLGLTAKF